MSHKRSEEYKIWHRVYAKDWYQKHKDEVKLRVKERHRLGMTADVLTDENRVDIKELAYERDYIKKQMEIDPMSDERAKLDDFLIHSDMNVKENRDQVIAMANRLSCKRRTLNGYHFERVIGKLMLNIFEGTPFKVYKQVPFGYVNDTCKNCRRVDFVVSEEDTTKDRIDFSKAVVISCKTTIDYKSGQIGSRLQNTFFYKCISKTAFKTALFTFISPLKTA